MLGTVAFVSGTSVSFSALSPGRAPCAYGLSFFGVKNSEGFFQGRRIERRD